MTHANTRLPAPPQEDEEVLEQYFREIRRIPRIDQAEEVRLAGEIRGGGSSAVKQSAVRRLVRANLRFVAAISRRYQNLGVPRADLINEGNLALMRAAREYDATRGAKFATYAGWWIRRAMQRAVAEQGRIFRLPAARAASIWRISLRRHELGRELGRDPTAREIADDMGLRVREIERSLSVAAVPLSLDEPTFGDETGSLRDILPARQPDPDEDALARARADTIEAAVGRLSEREAKVLRMHFGLGDGGPKSLEEIGDDLGVSGERVRQIKQKALYRLRRASGAGILKALR